MHSDAPTAMKHVIVDHAMATKVCHADFDDGNKMLDRTEVLAESSSGEASADEEYKAIMI